MMNKRLTPKINKLLNTTKRSYMKTTNISQEKELVDVSKTWSLS